MLGFTKFFATALPNYASALPNYASALPNHARPYTKFYATALPYYATALQNHATALPNHAGLYQILCYVFTKLCCALPNFMLRLFQILLGFTKFYATALPN